MKFSALLLVTLACLSSASFAQGGPPPGGGGSGATTTSQYYPITLSATLSGLSANQNVSGTNVRFTAAFADVSAPLEDPPAPNDWVASRLDGFIIKVGGQTVREWDGTPPSAPNPLPTGCAVRFQSTHFAEGSVTLEATGYFSLQKSQDVGTNVWYSVAPVTVTLSVNVYNKGFVMGTKVNANQVIESPASIYTNTTKAFVDTVESSLTTMKHGLLGTAGQAFYYKSDIVAALPSATVFCGTTHGSPTSFSSSYATDSSEYVSWATALSGRGSSIPAFNLVILYSCQTLDSSGDCASNLGFGISSSSVDQAYLGFPQEVSVATVIEDDLGGIIGYGTVANYASVLFASLQAGETVGKAVDDAYKAYKPYYVSNGSIVRVPMEIKGDQSTTLNSVYLTLSERFGLTGGTRWFWAPLPGFPN